MISNPNYTGSATGSLVINKGTQAAVIVNVPSSATYAQQGLFATASGGSGTAVGYAYSTTGSTACTVNAITGSISITSGTGTCIITATHPGDTNFNPASSLAATISVAKADADITYTGDTLVITSSNGTATINASATVTVDSTAAGELGNNRKLVFYAYKSTDNVMSNTSFAAICTASIGAPTQGVASAACSLTPALSADNYTMKIELQSNSFYDADDENVIVTVADPGSGTNGGGWVATPQGRGNFGFTAKFLKNGNVQGNSNYVYRKTTNLRSMGISTAPNDTREYNWIIKSNAMTGLMLTNCTTTTPRVCTNSTFSGKSTVTAVDRKTGIAYSLGGNYAFQVNVTDNGEPGTSDKYALRVMDGSTMYVVVGGYDANGTNMDQVVLGGGNIKIQP
jgi:hypothetical protein